MTTSQGVTVKDVPAADFIAAYARHLKRSGRMNVPRWVDLVKTGPHKELAPYDADWFYIRAASIARKVYIRPGQGVGTFRKTYGGSYRRGSQPNTFCKSSGSVARHVLKQLEKLKVVEKNTKGGRKITNLGQRDMDRISKQVAKTM